MKKRVYKGAVVAIMAAMLLGGCGHKQTQELKVGISPWPGYEPLVLASQKRFYENSRIKIIRFATPTESFRALRDGMIDVAAFTVDEVLHYAQVREQPKVFLVLDVSNGGDAIVARPGIKALCDLRGKRVAAEPSALGQYLLHRAMDFTEGLDVEELNVVPVEVIEHKAAYVSAKVDALVTYEPSKSLLLEAGAHVIFDSSQIPYEVVDILVANNATISEKRESLIELKRGWFRALAYIAEHEDEAMGLMAENEGLSKAQFAKAYHALKWPTLQENRAMLEEGHGSLLVPLEKLSVIMRKKGSLASDVPIGGIISSEIVKE